MLTSKWLLESFVPSLLFYADGCIIWIASLSFESCCRGNKGILTSFLVQIWGYDNKDDGGSTLVTDDVIVGFWHCNCVDIFDKKLSKNAMSNVNILWLITSALVGVVFYCTFLHCNFLCAHWSWLWSLIMVIIHY